ncbi:hypothetical protein [Microbulbifer magnicolonia]|uniref:hypothetical protein n=1 Tax=Microbulbifer magnicolonia TaxID=3109744 RepID=UPI002B4169C5|nr:hypothetical protein [Microbulbifer sp. GG15]
MSSLNERIQRCSQDMDKQRDCALVLLNRQKSDLDRRIEGIPLPAAIGLALVGGFLAQRLFRSPNPSRLFRLYLAWRAL